MNEHIELVKRWMEGEDISLEELRSNSEAADAADQAARNATRATSAARAARAAYDALAYEVVGSTLDAIAKAQAANYWLKNYEELTK